MNRYRITFTNFDAEKDRGFEIVVVAEAQEAKNGLDAIRAALRKRGVTETDILEARTIGSNKRLTLYGITFEANKL